LANRQEVFLQVPALAEFLRVARMTASGLATRLGFSLDEVDDLRLALDELCFSIIGKGDENATLDLRYFINSQELVISGNTINSDGSAETSLGELSQQILDALVDEHSVWDSEGFRHFTLTKRQATES